MLSKIATPFLVSGCLMLVACSSDDDPTTDNQSSSTAPTDVTEEGKCMGSAASCYGRPAGSCGSQRGCRFAQHSRIDYKGDLQLEYTCEGSANSCSSFRDESACRNQSGCRWQ